MRTSFLASATAIAALLMASPVSAAVAIIRGGGTPTGPGGGGQNVATVRVFTHVVNDGSGILLADSFLMTYGSGGSVLSTFTGMEDPGNTLSVSPGDFEIKGEDKAGYARTYSAECSGTLAENAVATCTVTYQDIEEAVPAEPVTCPQNHGNVYVPCEPQDPGGNSGDEPGGSTTTSGGDESGEGSTIPPQPQVLGATDEAQLPRTGLPAALLIAPIALGLALSRRFRA